MLRVKDSAQWLRCGTSTGTREKKQCGPPPRENGAQARYLTQREKTLTQRGLARVFLGGYGNWEIANVPCTYRSREWAVRVSEPTGFSDTRNIPFSGLFLGRINQGAELMCQPPVVFPLSSAARVRCRQVYKSGCGTGWEVSPGTRSHTLPTPAQPLCRQICSRSTTANVYL